VVVLSRLAATWWRGLYEPNLGPTELAGPGMPLLLRLDGYHDNVEVVPSRVVAALPSLPLLFFILRPPGLASVNNEMARVASSLWCTYWWVALMGGRLRILRGVVLSGLGEILVGLLTGDT
jgi:hypothetical protein